MRLRMQRLDNEAKERGKRICAMRHHLEALHRRILDRKHRLRALCAGIEGEDLSLSFMWQFCFRWQHCCPVSASVRIAMPMAGIGRERPGTPLADTTVASATPAVCTA